MTRTLLIIDIQNDYFPGGALPLWQAEETEARILNAISKARASGDKIVLVRHASPTSAGLLAANSPGGAIRPAILDATGDVPIVTKAYADAFQDTNLAKQLAGTRDLVVFGMMTQNCVAFTALSRLTDGFHLQVIGDLCTAPTELVHRIALNALSSKLPVSNTEEVWN